MSWKSYWDKECELNNKAIPDEGYSDRIRAMSWPRYQLSCYIQWIVYLINKHTRTW